MEPISCSSADDEAMIVEPGSLSKKLYYPPTLTILTTDQTAHGVATAAETNCGWLI